MVELHITRLVQALMVRKYLLLARRLEDQGMSSYNSGFGLVEDTGPSHTPVASSIGNSSRLTADLDSLEKCIRPAIGFL